MVFIFCSAATLSGADDSTSASKQGYLQPVHPDRFAIAARICGSYHIPVFDGGAWNNYPTAGIQIDFPTAIRAMALRFSLEGGILGMNETYARQNALTFIDEIKIFHMSFSVGYDFAVIKEFIRCTPWIGISNTMISIDSFNPANLFHFFRTFENEYGLLCGIEPGIRLNRLHISLPVMGNAVFTSPDLFINGIISLSIGMVF